MRILIDTHYVIWSFLETGKIKKNILKKLLAEENEVVYSQVSLWEISIKLNLGKLVLDGVTPEELYEEVENSYLRCLELKNDQLISFYKLPIEHKDPFDRMLIWQAIKEDYYFLTVDGQMEKYKKYGLKILS
jgi:PIN domain nuclease of toxin-antitoxin system